MLRRHRFRTVERVSQRCGFGSATALRVHFRRIVGTTPMAYRRTFGPDAEVVSFPRDPVDVAS